MIMKWKYTLLVSMFLILVSLSFSAQDVKFGSAFDTINDGDKAIARLNSAKNAGKAKAAKAEIVSTLKSMETGDKAMDSYFLKIASHVIHLKRIRTEAITKMDSDQMLRLIEKSEGKNYKLQGIIAKEFLKKYPQHEKNADVKFYSGRSHVLCDLTPKKSLSLWKDVKEKNSESSAARISDVYIEAVEGPKSIAALEAASEIAALQTKYVSNFMPAALFNSRVVDASKKDFFKNYIASEDIPVDDRAELLYKVMLNYHMINKNEDVERIAKEILSMNPEAEIIRDKAQFAISMSWFMRSDHEMFIHEAENYLCDWPSGKEAPRSFLYLGKTYQMICNIPTSLAYFKLCVELFPRTKAAELAQNEINVILAHDKNGIEEEADQILITQKEDYKNKKKNAIAMKIIKDKKIAKSNTVKKPNEKLVKKIAPVIHLKDVKLVSLVTD
jgi:hypothetical protein